MVAQPQPQLTYTQVFVTIASLMIGGRLLTLPRDVTTATGTPDGWISSLIGLAVIMIAGALAGLLVQLFPKISYFEFVPKIIGKYPGYLLATGYTIYFALFAAVEARTMAEVVRFYLLSDTPLEVIIMIGILPVLYLLYGGMNATVRIQQLFLPVILAIVTMVLLGSISTFKMDNLQPVLANGLLPVFKGVPHTAYANLGFAVIMIFAQYMQQPKQALASVLTAIGVVSLLNALVVFMSIGSINSQTLPTLIFPVMDVVRSIETPGGFIERLESLFLTFFIMAIFTSITIALFVSTLGLEKLYGWNSRQNLLVLTPFMTLISLWPANLNQVFELGKVVENLGIFYVGTVPALLFIIAKLRNLGQSTTSPATEAMRTTEEEVQA